MSQTATRLRPARHVCDSSHSEGVVLFDAAAGRLLAANLIGSVIWSQMRLGLTSAEILDVICREFDVDRCVAEPDLALFIVAAREQRLLEPRDPSGGES